MLTQMFVMRKLGSDKKALIESGVLTITERVPLKELGQPWRESREALPEPYLGLWVENRVHAGLSRESIQRIAAFLILGIGASLLSWAILK